MFLGAMHQTTKWPAQRKSLKNPRSKLTFLINGNPSFSRRQAFVYGSSTGFYSDSSSAAVAAAQTAAAAQHQGNLFMGVDKTTVRRQGISICLRMFSFQYHSYYKGTEWFKLAILYIYNYFQNIFSEWKPYMAIIVCKKLKQKKNCY